MSFWKTRINAETVYEIEHCNNCMECNKQRNVRLGLPKCVFSKRELLQYYLHLKRELDAEIAKRKRL